jgi:predicted ATPase
MQVLVSSVTAELANEGLGEGVSLLDLGEHRLKDLERPERIWQLVHADLPAEFPPLRSVKSPPHNLAALGLQSGRLVGREQDLVRIEAIFLDPRVRLLTLTGAGGVGKTRLAAAVAGDTAPEFSDGLAVVSLVGLDDANHVIPAISRVLGIREPAGDTPLATLKNFIGTTQRAIVLDNCERLVAAGSSIAELLAECPRLKILTTSRVRWRVYGERVIDISPLPYPAAPHQDIEALLQWPAVQLFAERVRDIEPEFTLTPATAPAVAEICQILDGLPLAIELAAARLNYLPVSALLHRMQQPLQVLVDGPRDRHPRHRTLRDAIDWSYQFLETSHRWLFRQLAVFAGGWSLEAAESVCAASPEASDTRVDILQGLGALIDASLVRQDASADEARFRMLETIREYALEQLARDNELPAARARHLAYFVVLGERANPHLNGGSEYTAWLQRLAVEEDNLRVALRWCIDTGDVENGLRLGTAVGRYWYVEGSPTEGHEWMQAILHLVGEAGEPALRAPALNSAALLALARGEYASAQILLEESLRLATALDNKQLTGTCLHNLGGLAARRCDYNEALRLLESAAAALESIQSPRAAITYSLIGNVLWEQRDFSSAATWHARCFAAYQQWCDYSGMASATGRMGFAAAVTDDLARAEVLSSTSLTYAQQVENRQELGWALLDVAFVHLLRKEYEKVRALCAEVVRLRTDNFRSHERTAAALQLLAAQVVETGDPHRAMTLFGAAARQWEAAHPLFHLWDDVMCDRWQTVAREQLGPAAEGAFHTGQGLAIEAAVVYALQSP